jgi:hypothetical protein
MKRIPTDYNNFPLNEFVLIKFFEDKEHKIKLYDDIIIKANSFYSYNAQINILRLSEIYSSSNSWKNHKIDKNWSYFIKDKYTTEEFYLLSEEEANSLIILMEL